MSNPTFVTGGISYEAAEDIKQFHLVKVDDKGAHVADAKGAFGAVADNAVKGRCVAVHVTGAVKLTVAGGDASAFKPGAKVFAAAKGEVAASGDVVVGHAVAAGAGGRVLTLLSVPASASAVAA